MPEEIKNLNKEVDKLESAAKKYASKDTVITIGGYEFTPAKLMVAFTIVSSILGGLYGTFEVYKDYVGMKKKIADYVSPDLSNFDKRLAIIEQNQTETSNALKDTGTALKDSASKTADYTRDIKNDLKNDIRKIETIIEQTERSVKQMQREAEQEMRQARKDIREDLEKSRIELSVIRKEMSDLRRDTTKEIEITKKELDTKIQKALDNPLANK